MKKFFKIISYTLGILILMIIITSFGLWVKYESIVSSKPSNQTESLKPGYYGKWVNNFIGTGGFPSYVCGMDFPGATLPFGMIRLSPETASFITNARDNNTSGYYYGDDKIIGFSHTRLAGTGATDGGHFLITPTTSFPNEIDFSEDYSHSYSHSDESAFPGYYSVQLRDENIYCELTATERVGMHRYMFTNNSNASLILNVTNTIGGKRSEDGIVVIDVPKNEIFGSVRTFGSFAGRYGGIKVYFVAKFDELFKDFGIWDGDKFTKNRITCKSNNLKIYLNFNKNNKTNKTNKTRNVNVKLAISHVSVDNARLNLEHEVGNKSFNEICNRAIDKWEEKLSLISIDCENDNNKWIFYSSLYRCFQMPTIFNDANGKYIGFDKKVHEVTNFNYYTDLSLWDTFRTIHPLFNLIAKDYQRDMIISLLKMAEQGGGLPRWPSGYGYTGSMLGSPADIAISESYLKGIKDFDVEFAFSKMKETALGPIPQGAPNSGRRGIEGYLKYGYCPNDIQERSVSRTLEYAWADNSIRLLAGKLRHYEDSLIFAKHSKYFKNVWNPNTQYFQARNSDGSFVKEFKPLQLTYTDWDDEYTKGYVEGSALQWRWAVPYDADGLISLFRNRDYFISELNNFFELADPAMAAWNPGSYYWHGNEPDIHAAYLFNYAGRPDLTQKWVRWILDNKYDNTYTGIDGNDDAGTLSAWYVFSSLGFYPIAGSDIYQLGAPLFQNAEIKLGENSLQIIADNYSPSNIYVKEIYLNNSLLDRSWIKHSEISNGGILRFVMSKMPVIK